MTRKKFILMKNGLYQNILVTGTIGSGKTSSSIYPFIKQFISYMCQNHTKKIGMLILDVKGNLHNQVKKYCKEFDREDDLITLELSGMLKYNPLHKPNLKPIILANRLKTILTLFSPNNSESYWLDKAEQVLAEAIKLCRLYNNEYVTFLELHKLINDPTYYHEKIKLLRTLFQQNYFTTNTIYDLLSCINFFEKEFYSLDSRVLSILTSEINRITLTFISDYEILNTFCPDQKDLNFIGFSDVLSQGKIVVLNMNIADYKNLSKIIASYLKLDFQSEILSNISTKFSSRTTAFICDEFHEYVTSTDSDFFALSREANCINIIATQSYTSLLNTLKDLSCTKTIIQNLINKLWYRTDDIMTIEDAQKQIGKEEKKRISQSISENAKETNYDYFTNSLKSQNSSLSETFNTFTQSDFIYDTRFFTQNLETFSALGFISDGNKILHPCKLNMVPYFEQEKEKMIHLSI